MKFRQHVGYLEGSIYYTGDILQKSKWDSDTGRDVETPLLKLIDSLVNCGWNITVHVPNHWGKTKQLCDTDHIVVFHLPNSKKWWNVESSISPYISYRGTRSKMDVLSIGGYISRPTLKTNSKIRTFLNLQMFFTISLGKLFERNLSSHRNNFSKKCCERHLYM